jgi:Cof subfamily protein (haloacid dehalogenase superfamily)
MKGLIALDIDGTLTSCLHTLSPKVIQCLQKLAEQNWIISLVTGRCYSFSLSILQYLNFPYYIALQNGALILQMPEKKMLLKQCLDSSIIPNMCRICDNEPTDFVLYTGPDNEDRCYYRPDFFDEELRGYLERRIKDFNESWYSVEDWSEVPSKEFTSFKCFGSIESLRRISLEIEKEILLQTPIIRDPYSKDFFLMQATHPNAHKGKAVESLKDSLNIQGPIIAAGDDFNDYSMLLVADVRIAMAHAPEDLKNIADIVTLPLEEDGIVRALENAIRVNT